jgi:hypothetical protein
MHRAEGHPACAVKADPRLGELIGGGRPQQVDRAGRVVAPQRGERGASAGS